jgi:hypothetical protein
VNDGPVGRARLSRGRAGSETTARLGGDAGSEDEPTTAPTPDALGAGGRWPSRRRAADRGRRDTSARGVPELARDGADALDRLKW